MKKIGAEIWDFFKVNFKWILVAVAALILYSRGCFGPKAGQQPTITHDTVVIIHEYQGAPYVPPVINVLPSKPTVINQPQYKPDTSSIQALRAQFEALVKKHTDQNVYKDRLLIDTLGYVDVKDTVSENKLVSRSYDYSIKERLITTTKTLPAKLKNKLLFGGGVTFPLDVKNLIQDITLGLQFQNKKDNILGVYAGYNIPQSGPIIGVSYYQKIKFK